MREITLIKLPDALDDLLNDFLKESFETRQNALQAGAEFMKEKMEIAAPKDTGEYASSFTVKKNNNANYIGNSVTVSGKGRDGRYRENIPLANILEYGDNPHIRQTFDNNKNQMFEIIKNNLGGK